MILCSRLSLVKLKVKVTQISYREILIGTVKYTQHKYIQITHTQCCIADMVPASLSHDSERGTCKLYHLFSLLRVEKKIVHRCLEWELVNFSFNYGH